VLTNKVATDVEAGSSHSSRRHVLRLRRSREGTHAEEVEQASTRRSKSSSRMKCRLGIQKG